MLDCSITFCTLARRQAIATEATEEFAVQMPAPIPVQLAVGDRGLKHTQRSQYSRATQVCTWLQRVKLINQSTGIGMVAGTSTHHLSNLHKDSPALLPHRTSASPDCCKLAVNHEIPATFHSPPLPTPFCATTAGLCGAVHARQAHYPLNYKPTLPHLLIAEQYAVS